MATKTETAPGAFDYIKLIVALALIIGGAIAFTTYGEFYWWARLLILLAVIAIALGIAVTTPWGSTGWGFVKDSRSELRKVVWPNRQETVQTTLIVIVMVIIVGLMLWLMDWLLTHGRNFLLGIGG